MGQETGQLRAGWHIVSPGDVVIVVDGPYRDQCGAVGFTEVNQLLEQVRDKFLADGGRQRYDEVIRRMEALAIDAASDDQLATYYARDARQALRDLKTVGEVRKLETLAVEKGESARINRERLAFLETTRRQEEQNVRQALYKALHTASQQFRAKHQQKAADHVSVARELFLSAWARHVEEIELARAPTRELLESWTETVSLDPPQLPPAPETISLQGSIAGLAPRSHADQLVAAK
jgi:hypothetical protein